MRDLVLAYGYKIALVNENVRSLEHRIAEETVGAQILLRNILALFFVGRNALQPAQRRDHGEQQVQFSMLRHV